MQICNDMKPFMQFFIWRRVWRAHESVATGVFEDNATIQRPHVGQETDFVSLNLRCTVITLNLRFAVTTLLERLPP